jgi:hypothetical protein
MAREPKSRRSRDCRPDSDTGQPKGADRKSRLRAAVVLLCRALRALAGGGRWIARSAAWRRLWRLVALGLTLALIGLGRLSRAGSARLGRFGLRHPGPVFTFFLAILTSVVLAYAPNASGTYSPADKTADLECLALNIYHEARSEPDNGKLAVGHVVLNRALDPRFPGSLCEVVKQGGERPLHACQFSWWCDGRSDRPRDGDAWEDSRLFADLIFNGTITDPTGGALWYHADYVDPPWRDTLVEGPKIGRHLFYLED